MHGVAMLSNHGAADHAPLPTATPLRTNTRGLIPRGGKLSLHPTDMEAFSVASSVIAVLDMSAKANALCLQYSKDLMRDDVGFQQLRSQVGSLQNTSAILHQRLNDPGFNLPQQLRSVVDDTLSQLTHVHEALQARPVRGLHSWKWPFRHEDVDKIMQDLHHQALMLSQAILLIDATLLDAANKKSVLDRLPIANGASLDSLIQEHSPTCLSNTRTELLRQIYDWADDSSATSIFWLTGLAGTGKSTISRTVAWSWASKGQLAASFFFRRNEPDLGALDRFFTTIAAQLAVREPAVATYIRDVLDADPLIISKKGLEQFEKLVQQPLLKLAASDKKNGSIMLTIDALDECGQDHEIRLLIHLLSSIKQPATHGPSNRFKFFITSRNELPIRIGFNNTPGTYQELRLNEISISTMESDIHSYLKHALARIREDYNASTATDQHLPETWPGQPNIDTLTKISGPLFIVAATLCRYISNWRAGTPDKQLQKLLNDGKMYQNSAFIGISGIYMLVLNDLTSGLSDSEQAEAHKHFQDIMGPILILASPLSTSSLAQMLGMPRETVEHTLHMLHPVLNVPDSALTPIGPLHPSFRDFLLHGTNSELNPFWIDENKAHKSLAGVCAGIMSRYLRTDMCDLGAPEITRLAVSSKKMDAFFTDTVRYACLYWTFHIQKAAIRIQNGDQTHVFLTRHFFHWIEALSLLGVAPKALEMIQVLQACLESHSSSEVLGFLEDCTQLLSAKTSIVDSAPLQVYSSMPNFAPQRRLIRKLFGRELPSWTSFVPYLPEWHDCLQTLEGHSDLLNSVAFSCDSKLIISASYDKTCRIWLAETGECKQELQGHRDWVSSASFSHDSTLAVSGSGDRTVRVWRVDTGECIQELKGHTDWVSSVEFSHDSSIIASASGDLSIRIWLTDTGVCVRELLGHGGWISSVSFSHDSKLIASGSDDKTVRVWRTGSGDCVQELQGHSSWVSSVEFSSSSDLIVSASGDLSIRIWTAGNGTCIQELKGHHKDWIGSVSFSHDATLIGSGSGDGTVRLWNVETGDCIKVFEGHKDSISAVAFSHDSSLVISASDDRTVRIWSATKSRRLRPDIDEQSDISDISNVSSVLTFATYSTAHSAVSAGGSEVALQAAVKTLAYQLYVDPGVHDLYLDAFQAFDATRFAINHDKLLKIFMKDLLRASTDVSLSLAIKLLGRRQARTLVTAQLHRLLQAEMNPSTENRQATQGFLGQQEERNLTLNALLRSEQPGNLEEPAVAPLAHEPGEAIPERTAKEPDDSDEEEEEDNDDDDDDDDDEYEEENYVAQPDTFEHLDALVEFFTTGSPILSFRSNLACLIHPPTTLPAAIATGNIRALKRLLRKKFDTVAHGEYSWLRELEYLGYTRDEIAELLLEEASDSPWIFFTPAPKLEPNVEIQLQHHLNGCVHQLSWQNQYSDEPENMPMAVDGTSSVALTEIQRYCGLAGITPSSREPENWNGLVVFKEENSVALVSYAHHDIRRVVRRITNALELLCSAISRSQSAGLCCESFTILQQPATLSNRHHGQHLVVEACRVNFSFVVKILAEIRLFGNPENIGHADIPATTELMKLLFPEIDWSEHPESFELPTALHICALATQVMSVGFQSYTQSHVGSFHPFFLDTPIQSIKLLGCHNTLEEHPYIEFGLRKLTCIGEMLQELVFAFGSRQPEGDGSRVLTDVEQAEFDIFTNSEDLIDTWGPGHFIVPASNNKLPSAIWICGGIIFMPDPSSNMFHWSRNVSPDKFCRGELDPAVKIRIGSPVTVNDSCTLNVTQCRARYSGYLRPLGTYAPGWCLLERQIGLQAGMYAMFQANTAYHKYAGRTLKQHRLEQGDEELVPFLEDHWAVQVSLCTGVARRISLRKMIAELLPVFANTLTFRDDCINWETLRMEHGILEAFRGTELKSWLRVLSKPLHDLVLRIIRLILQALSETGLDRKGKSLIISWPYCNDTFQGFEIDLRQEESSWARLIADSEDCATFAYVSPKCLETADMRCRGVESCWRNVVPLLETTVMACPAQETTPHAMTRSLSHNETYYFKKFEELHFVRVEKPDSAAFAKLVERSNNIPEKFRLRVLVRAQLMVRLRERNGVQENGEKVAMLTSRS